LFAQMNISASYSKRQLKEAKGDKDKDNNEITKILIIQQKKDLHYHSIAPQTYTDVGDDDKGRDGKSDKKWVIEDLRVKLNHDTLAPGELQSYAYHTVSTLPYSIAKETLDVKERSKYPNKEQDKDNNESDSKCKEMKQFERASHLPINQICTLSHCSDSRCKAAS
ncbi:hypothetical protein RFI_03222, partial [Reticulomyxa filosa]